MKTLNLKNIFVGAIVIRLLFSLLFFHPDIKSQHFHTQFLRQGIVDIYGYIDSHLKILPYRDTFNYPPLTYYLLGAVNFTTSLFAGPDFTPWLNDWGPDAYTSKKMQPFILLLKIPYIILDLGIAVLLFKFLEKERTKIRLSVLSFWLFNPLTLYAVYMLSQFDILAVFSTVAALYFTRQNKIIPAAIALGLGAMIKSYPLLFVPFVLLRAKSLKSALLSLAGLSGALLLPIIPVISSSAFRYTMTHSNLMQSIFESGIGVGGNQQLIFFIIAYVLAFWFSYNRRNNSDLTAEFFTVTLSVLVFSAYHAQWVLWCLPFAAIIWARTQGKLWAVFTGAVVGFLLLAWLIPDQFALLGLLTPINPQVLQFPALPDLVKKVTDPGFIITVSRTLLFSSGLLLIYKSWKLQDTHD
jgi:hypothetical protein